MVSSRRPSAAARLGWRRAKAMTLPQVTSLLEDDGLGRLIERARVHGAIELGGAGEVLRSKTVADQRAVAVREGLAKDGLYGAAGAGGDVELVGQLIEQGRPFASGGLIDHQRTGRRGVAGKWKAGEAADEVRLEDKVGGGERGQSRHERRTRVACGGSPFGRQRKRTASDVPSHDWGKGSRLSLAVPIGIAIAPIERTRPRQDADAGKQRDSAASGMILLELGLKIDIFVQEDGDMHGRRDTDLRPDGDDLRLRRAYDSSGPWLPRQS